MKRELVILALIGCLIPGAAPAQDARLEALLERQLTSGERVVEIDGLAGALSAQASLQELRISDAQGVWFVLEDAQLEWNRAALLRGRLDVTALTAGRMQILRAPAAGSGMPDAEASGFRIPDLPIAVNMDTLAVDEVFLGAPLLGEAVTARVAAGAALDGAGVRLNFTASRTDSRRGEVVMDLALDRTDERLSVSARVDEPAGGVVAAALGIPDEPSVAFEVAGEGPLDAFRADVLLATDGAERLRGQVSIQAIAGSAARRFAADFQGDVRALLAKDVRAFFGSETALEIAGVHGGDGALDLTRLDVRTAQLRATGRMRLSAGGAPELVMLDIGLGGGAAVQLPGTDVRLADAAMSLRFDAAAGEDWTLSGAATQVVTRRVSLGEVTLDAAGRFLPGTETAFAGQAEVVARSVDVPGDPDLARAIGPDMRLSTNVEVRGLGALALSSLRIDTPQGRATGRFAATAKDGRWQLAAALDVRVPTLVPFSGLAGLPLEGSLAADLGMEAEVPGGTVSVTLNGRSEGLDIGQPMLGPLLSPGTDLSFAALRDERGTRIETLKLENTELSAEVRGSVDGTEDELEATMKLRDGGVLDPRLAGALALEASLRDLRDTLGLTARITAEAGIEAALAGSLGGDARGLEFSAAVVGIERFAAPLTGVAELDGTLDLNGPYPVVFARARAAPGLSILVRGPVSGPGAQIAFVVRVQDLGAFLPPLPGPSQATGTLDLTKGVPEIAASLRARPGISAELSGPITATGAPLEVSAAIADMGRLVAPLPGPAILTAEVRDLTGTLTVAAQLDAPRGVRATVTGQPLGVASALRLALEMQDLGVLVPQLPGPARLEGAVEDLAGAQRVNAVLAARGLHAQLEGALAAGQDRMTLSARLDRIAPSLPGGASLTVQLRDLRGTPTGTASLRADRGARSDFSGSVDLAHRRADLTMTGEFPLDLAAPFAGNRALSGNAQLDLRLAGPLQLSSLAGRVQVRGARLFDPAAGLTVSGLNATADVQAARVRITARGVANEGTLDLSGTFGLTPPFDTDLSLRVSSLAYSLQSAVQATVTADVTLQGPAARRLAVSGAVDLFDTELRVPDTGLGGAAPVPDITHVGESQGTRRTLARAGLADSGGEGGGAGPGPAIPLNVRITARDPILLRGRGLDAAFEGGLRLEGTAADPIPVGQFRLRRGRLDFLGRRLDLVEGSIAATGTAMPRLRVVAETELEDLTARIIVEGPANAPEVTVTSSPERPQDEVLAQLLFGRGADSLSLIQAARLISSVRTLAGKGDGVLEQTRQTLGIDSFGVRTDETTGTTELSLGRQVSERVYSEIDVDSAGEVNLNLNLDLGPRTRLRGSVSDAGDTGLGVFWQVDY